MIDKKNREKKQVYEETAARMMTDILEGVLIRGTASVISYLIWHVPGKTGTTNDKKTDGSVDTHHITQR